MIIPDNRHVTLQDVSAPCIDVCLGSTQESRHGRFPYPSFRTFAVTFKHHLYRIDILKSDVKFQFEYFLSNHIISRFCDFIAYSNI